MHNPEPHAELYLNNQRLHMLHVNIQDSLTTLTVNNQVNFLTNSPVLNINTSNKHHLHRPYTNLFCFQKSTFYAGIKILNSLPPSVAILKNDEAKFKVALRKYLNGQFFLVC